MLYSLANSFLNILQINKKHHKHMKVNRKYLHNKTTQDSFIIMLHCFYSIHK